MYSVLVSMQTLAADVQGLRKGLDLTKSERDKQPDNFIIFVSFCYFLKTISYVVIQFCKPNKCTLLFLRGNTFENDFNYVNPVR